MTLYLRIIRSTWRDDLDFIRVNAGLAGIAQWALERQMEGLFSNSKDIFEIRKNKCVFIRYKGNNNRVLNQMTKYSKIYQNDISNCKILYIRFRTKTRLRIRKI